MVPRRISTRASAIFMSLAILFPLTACEAAAPDASTPSPLAPSPLASSADRPALPGSILFARAGGQYGDETVFMLSSGGEERQLTKNGAACCARLSPDGSLLLLLPSDQPAGPLASSTGPVEGNEFTRLTSADPTVNLVAQLWSPDGTRIAAEGWVADTGDDGRTGVYTSSYPDGSDLDQLTVSDTGGHDVPADYSPDGSQIVFFRGQPEPNWDIGGSLWIAQTDGGGVSRLDTGNVVPSWWARWSPDGEKILFATGRVQGSGSIWTVKPDGTELTEVYRAEGSEFPITPVWSPDGSQIMFAIDPHDNQFAHPPNRVVVMDMGDGQLTTVIDDATFKRHFSWVG